MKFTKILLSIAIMTITTSTSLASDTTLQFSGIQADLIYKKMTNAEYSARRVALLTVNEFKSTIASKSSNGEIKCKKFGLSARTSIFDVYHPPTECTVVLKNIDSSISSQNIPAENIEVSPEGEILSVIPLTVKVNIGSDQKYGKMARSKGVSAQVNILALSEINNRAHEILPMDQLILSNDPIEAQQQLSALIMSRLQENQFKNDIKEIRDNIASFLVTGGLQLANDASKSSEADLAIFTQIPNLHPLMFLLTRSVLFKAHDDFLKDATSYIISSDTPVIGGAVPSSYEVLGGVGVAIANPIAGFALILHGLYVNSRITTGNANKEYLTFEYCAHQTMIVTSENTEVDPKCDNKDSLELVSSYRKFTLGSLLLNFLVETQKSRGQTYYSQTSIGSGTYKEQLEKLSAVNQSKLFAEHAWGNKQKSRDNSTQTIGIQFLKGME